ncbi:MAG: fused MFS/spermidine synthase [Phycisphaerales bacterium]
MLVLYAATAFVAAALLFVIQPLAGKALLPLAGSSPSVWTSVMLLFQAALLMGYGIAHAVSHLGMRGKLGTSVTRVIVALVVLAGAAAVSRFVDVPSTPPESSPGLWVLVTLAMWVGCGFVGVAMLSPLLQQWFASTRHAKAANPYVLSVASNIGSAVGLIAYPLVIERTLVLRDQWLWWGYGVMGLFVLVVMCAIVAMRGCNSKSEMVSSCNATPSPNENQTSTTQGLSESSSEGLGVTRISIASVQSKNYGGLAPTAQSSNRWHVGRAGQSYSPTLRTCLAWLAFAFVPSSLMLGVTQHISTDIAPVPLLWIVPLLMYLLSFAWAFAPVRQPGAAWWGRAMVVPVLALALALLVQARTPIVVVLSLHLVVFFVGCMMCHKSLSERRPDPKHLTVFYFVIAMGGVLGGIFNAIVAPAVFDRVLEYPIALGLLLTLRELCAAEQTRDSNDIDSTDVQVTLKHFKSRALVVVGVACIAACVGLVLIIDRVASQMTISQLGRSALVGGVPTLFLAILAFAAQKYRHTVASKAVFVAGGAGLLLASQFVDSGVQVLHQERTFFGVHRVLATNGGKQHDLRHGTTSHGVQVSRESERFEELRQVPGAYYHPSGPIGIVMSMMQQRRQHMRVGLIGLGAGALASYAREGDSFTFFELDPSVIHIAQDAKYFTFVSDARDRGATITMVPGDGRLTLAKASGHFDVLVIDAFSSDAIPTHLLTREAMELYLSKLSDDGVLAFHISNRSFDLAPVLARHALDMKLIARKNADMFASPMEAQQGKFESHWFVMAKTDQGLSGLARAAMWYQPDVVGSLWTDDRSDILSVFMAW